MDEEKFGNLKTEFMIKFFSLLTQYNEEDIKYIMYILLSETLTMVLSSAPDKETAQQTINICMEYAKEKAKYIIEEVNKIES